ncbi:LysR family transcriptional regulator [Chthonobacter albigriseus]|uniref:LysR family transcriptional regulator n=1 Tax=Chthonobacter albigriseus TaxID=1683161 RepID=UPI0015EF1EDF|nr:LysR family transcriptional regulator [Chthonobacter albigriseus]
MSQPDLNLLVTLDALLSEGSVVGAAKRLQLSPSAMSRALTRLRETTGDPLLVRAGRSLVPTPRAMELRGRVGSLVDEAMAVLRPAETLDLARLTRVFTLRNREGFVENFGPALVSRVALDAPGARLRFLPKADKDSLLLREGAVDLETGVLGEDIGPEIRAQALFRDRFVAVVRAGHPLVSSEITATAYAAARHVLVSRRGSARGPVDAGLARLGLERAAGTEVGSFSEALALVRATDSIATVPERFTGTLREGLLTLPLPFQLPALTISLLWHPRMDADPAHRWLRECVREVCQNVNCG